MPQVDCAAPAKINWYLEVLGRRPDGFHALETVFQTLELADRVTVRSLPGGSDIRLVVAGGDAAVPTDESNLAWRAARSFRQVCSACGTVEIVLDKRIPCGGGLGGGSSDAAAVLRCLDHLFPGAVSAERLFTIAAGLGSDVPFFLLGGQAHGVGRGELLTPLPDPPDRQLHLVLPPFGCPTPAVFAALTPAERGPRHPRGPDRLRCAAEQPGHNRLWPAACRVVSALAELGSRLSAADIRWFLSGSGSTLVCLDPPPALPDCQVLTTGLRRRARLDR